MTGAARCVLWVLARVGGEEGREGGRDGRTRRGVLWVLARVVGEEKEKEKLCGGLQEEKRKGEHEQDKPCAD